MSNPTDRYGWSFPTENADPWYLLFAGAYQAIDATVNSVEQIGRALGRTTLVISCLPSADIMWPATTTLPAENFSTICSVAPYGALQGTVTVPASGCQVRFDLELNLAPFGTSNFSGAAITQYFRLVTATSGNLFGGTNWIFQHVNALHYSQVQFTGIASLGAGAHTVQLQQRALSTTTQASFTVGAGNYAWVRLWATPQAR
jgi:hypothetical protein